MPNRMLFLVVFALAAGASIGYGLGVTRDLSQAITPLAESALLQVADAPEEDRCRQAEELYGQVLIAALAQLGTRLTPEARTQLEASSAGKSPSARRTSPAPPPSPPAATAPEPSPASAPSRSPEPAPSKALTPTPSVKGIEAPARPSQGTVPSAALNRLSRVRDQRGCLATRPDWFTQEATLNEYDIRVSTIDPSEGPQIRVQNLAGLHPSQPARVTRCFSQLPQPGTRIRFTAEVRATGTIENAQVLVRAENRDRARLAESVREVRRAPEWRTISLELEVTEETRALEFSLVFQGSGSLTLRHPMWVLM